MSPLKKTLLMLFSTQAMYFAMILYDQYEIVVAPMLSDGGVATVKGADQEVVFELTKEFNRRLRTAYETQSATPLASFAMKENERARYHIEINFLKREGIIQEIDITDTKLISVKRSSQFSYDVITQETFVLRNINAKNGKTMRSFPEKTYQMIYQFETVTNKWVLLSASIHKVRGLNES